MSFEQNRIIIVGGGLAGLACAHWLTQEKVPFTLFERGQNVGGRLKTEHVDGYLLNYGFQVLQTAYPEARRLLKYETLNLKSFAPGVMIRLEERFFRIADPRRRPLDMWETLTAPIGSIRDRLVMLRMAGRIRRSTVAEIFQAPDMPTIDFLHKQGFSDTIIQTFFKPFFANVCLDPDIEASSRVFRHIFQMFSKGDVALPAHGMAAIADQIAETLPAEQVKTGMRVDAITKGNLVLGNGKKIKARAIVIATEGPETARLLGKSNTVASQGEWCLYFSATSPPVTEPFLVLNGNSGGWVSSLSVPSVVAPSYAPPGRSLISVVVLGHQSASDTTVTEKVHQEMTAWFGPQVKGWQHLKTLRIQHALPEQPPPSPNPTENNTAQKRGVYACGEYNGVPGIQWALLSGRHAAERVIDDLKMGLD